MGDENAAVDVSMLEGELQGRERSERENGEDMGDVVAVAMLDGEPPQRKKNWEGDWPKSLKFLIWTEFCERFSFVGLKTIMALFLREHIHISENGSAEFVHLLIVMCYFTPLLGSILSDVVVGKYRTILWLSVIYSIGNCVLAAAAVPDTDSDSNSLGFWMTSAGLLFIAIGTGGIKPCVPAFGGDQIELGLPEGPIKERLQRQFFSVYYFTVNAAAFISSLVTPVLRTNVSYAVAFSVPAALTIVAMLIFWAGSGHYIDRKPEGHVFAQVGIAINDAVKFNLFPSAAARANSQEIDVETHLLGSGEGANDQKSMQWLDPAKRTHGAIPVEDVKSLLAVVIILLPAPLFWSLFDQQYSKWVFQGSRMNRKMPWWLGGVVVKEDQMVALTPVFLLGMIPIFHQGIYPFLDRRGWSLKPIPRMWLGIASSAVAFVISALVQIWMDLAGAPISILWQIPQYIMVSTGETLFAIAGLEFAYSQAPASMKSVVQAVWLFCVAGGNLITFIIIAVIGDSLSAANEYFFFAFLAAIAALVMIWLGSGFEYKHEAEAKPLPDSEEYLKIQ